jgi:hypothetical protein
VRRSKIHDNKDAGVMVWQKGAATMEDCELWKNGKNFDLHKGCTVQQRGCIDQ